MKYPVVARKSECGYKEVVEEYCVAITKGVKKDICLSYEEFRKMK